MSDSVNLDEMLSKGQRGICQQNTFYFLRNGEMAEVNREN